VDREVPTTPPPSGIDGYPMEKEPNALGGNSSLLAIPEEYTLLYIGRTWIDPKGPIGNSSGLLVTLPPLGIDGNPNEKEPNTLGGNSGLLAIPEVLNIGRT